VVFEGLPAEQPTFGQRPPPVAIKRAMHREQHLFEMANMEAEVLKRLAQVLPLGSEAAHAPVYLCHETLRHTVGGSVTIAMSKVEGAPLDKWLYGVEGDALAHMDTSRLLEGPFPDGGYGSRDLDKASSTTARLAVQSAQVFEMLSEFAYHRDISAHNFLIDVKKGLEVAEFGVIDFGLAVWSRSWQHNWQKENMAGDPRYWSPATWAQVAGQTLSSDMRRQYAERLDHFPFGVLLCEIFFGLWNRHGVQGDPALNGVLLRWKDFRAKSNGLSKDFHQHGPDAMVKRLQTTREANQLQGFVDALCSSLRSAAKSTPEHVAVLLCSISDLLDARGTMTWRQVQLDLAERLFGSTARFGGA
jgi:serine/threonine protein kinase